jgi:Flp pilus assembly pilin Flp
MFKEVMEKRTEQGQTMAEYTVVLGVITFVIVATFALFSDAINDSFLNTVEIVESVF